MMTPIVTAAFLLVAASLSGCDAFLNWSWPGSASTDADIERVGSAPWSLDPHLCSVYFNPPCYRHHELVYQWIAEVSMQDLPLAVSGEACKTNKTLCDRYARAMRQYNEKNFVKLERVVQDTVKASFEQVKNKIAEVLRAQLDHHHMQKVLPEFERLELLGTEAIERLKRVEVNTMTSWTAMIRDTLSRMAWNNGAGFISLCILLESTRKLSCLAERDVRSGFLWSLFLVTLPWFAFAEKLTDEKDQTYDVMWIAVRNVGLVAIQNILLIFMGFGIVSWGENNAKLAEMREDAKRKKRLAVHTDCMLAEAEAKRNGTPTAGVAPAPQQRVDTAGRYDIPPAHIPAQRSQPGPQAQPDTMDDLDGANSNVYPQLPVKPEDSRSSIPLGVLASIVQRGVAMFQSTKPAEPQSSVAMGASAPAQSLVVLQTPAPASQPPSDPQSDAQSSSVEEYLRASERAAYESRIHQGRSIAQAAAAAERAAALSRLGNMRAAADRASEGNGAAVKPPRRSSRSRSRKSQG